MAKYSFGSGQLFAAPVGGGAPMRFGAVQDVSVDIQGDIKMLYGQNQFPLALARGKSKIEGKFGSGQLDVDLYNRFFFGQTVSTGQLLQAINEVGTIPGSSVYTVTAANGADFEQDLGVFFASNGEALKQVASGPTAGQYSVSNAGVYTFAAADANKGVLLNYLYTSDTTGRTLAINNLIMGDLPSFQVILAEKFQGKSMVLQLYSCVSDKLSLPFKQDDFMISDISFSAQADAAGRIGRLSHG